MNFEFTEDQKLLKAMVRDFAQKEVEPKVKILEDTHEFPREFLDKLGKLGILGMTIPSEYGGTKTDHLSLILALEEIARASPSLAVIVSVHCALFCYSITKFGNKTQKEKYLPKAAKGEILGAFSLTEPGAGSDATNLKTKSIREGDFYILNGTKSWVTTGSEADASIIFASTEIKPGVKKLNAFIVEKNFPGFLASKIEEKMGLNSSLTAEYVLEDCQVPAENLLGEEGKGAAVAFHCLDGSRIGIAAQAVGLADKAIEEGVKYAQQREAFGRKISEFQAIQFMIADMSTLRDAARLLTYKAADLIDKGKPYTKESSMAKLFASEAANARVFPIYEGTSEIQRLVISRYLLEEC
jgi:alkylation response protein AidB-like acyl-CoA dehydrogenase